MNPKSIKINLIAAAAYFVAGLAGLTLAIPPGNATAVWPAAGVALALILTYGLRLLPGILLGSILIQVQSYLDTSSTENIITSIKIGALVSIGVILQVWVAVKLVQSIMRNDPALLKERSVLMFYLLTGPVSSIVSASIGIAVLITYGVITTPDIPVTWSRWWIGDAIGVVVFTPIILCLFAEPHDLWRQRRLSVALPLCILALASFIAFKISYHHEMKHIESVFERNALQFKNVLKENIYAHMNETLALKDFFDSSSHVLPEDFSGFVKPKLSRFPQIKAIEWIPKVLHQERADFEERVGAPITAPDQTGQMKIAPNAEVYYPIQYIEPYSGNEKALGYNIRSNPIALKATDSALSSSNKIAVTDAFKIIQDTKNYMSVVFYAPVFKKNNLTEQYNNIDSLLGFATTVFLLENEISILKNKSPSSDLSIILKNSSQVLYNDKSEADLLHNIPNQFNFARLDEINVANQQWQLQLSPATGFMALYSSWSIWFVIVGGLLITSFSGIGLLMLTGQRFRIDEKIKSRTTELRNEITERKQIEATLQESNERFKAAYAEAPIGMSLVSLNHNIIEANQSFHSMLGYPDNSLIGKYFTEISHHEDIEKSKSYHNQLIAGEIDNYQLEKRYLHKQGHVVWAQLNVSLVMDNNAKPLYAIAQIQNISDRKSSEKALQKTYRVQSMVGQCNDALLYIRDEKQLLEKICKIIVESGDYIMAGVGFLNDDEEHTINMVAFQGHDAGYINAINIALTDKQRRQGPTYKAIRRKQPYVVKNISEDPDFLPWRDAALQRGFHSHIALPLIMNDSAFGVLRVYSPIVDAFNEDEITLLEKLANNLAFGIDVLRMQVTQKQTELRHRTLIEATTAIIWTTDKSGGFVVPQISWEKFTGQPWEEHKGTGWINKIHPDDQDKLLKEWKNSIEKFTPYVSSGRIWNANLEEWRNFEVNAIPILTPEGLLSEWVGVVNDITEKINANKEIHKLSQSVEHSPNVVMITNKDGIIEYVNPVFTKTTGYTEEETIGQSPSFFIAEEVSHQIYKKSRQTIQSGKSWHGEFVSKKKNGDVYLSAQTIFPIQDDFGNITHIVSIHEDITEEKRMSEQLSYYANHDDLTGLINRREFERRAKRLLSAMNKDREEHALCYIDLDQFKVVNDTCGHVAGDELLRQLSSVLESTVRKRDTLARLGGDEFGVLMEHCSLDGAHRVAESLHKTVQDFQFNWEGKIFKVGVSIGLTPITAMTLDITELLKDADAACYMAKEKGRNRIHVYHPEDTEIANRHGEMLWVSRIHQALADDLFCLYAQTIEALESNKGNHYELLLRMIDEKGNIIAPGLFLPSAERYDLISKIDRWVIKNTFRELANHPQFLSRINFCSINLSGQSMADADFLNFVISQFDVSGIDSSKICFEITETAAISNLSTAIRFMSTLKGYGCYFALDDFGSGLSSFAYLKNLPVDYLKIDGMFIKDIVDDPIDHAMVKSINEIGQVMGMKTIAEFVENDVIKGMLKEIGIDYVQGYGIGKPLPLEELLNKSSYNNVVKITNKK